MDGWMAEAFFHGELPEFFGRRLRPLCARHVLALEVLGSGFVGGAGAGAGAEVSGVEDLAVGWLVCSCGDEDELQELVGNFGRYPLAAGEFASRLGGDLELGWRMEGAFRKYWSDYFQCAELVRGGPGAGGGRGRWQCHWVTIVVAALVRGGYRPQDAWWMPIGEGLAMKLASFEVEGRSFRIMGDAEREAFVRLGWNPEDL
jgi:hypothetical protein